MMSLIHDNGIVSPFNRGTFYGCRDLNGQLEGVALVGHATLMETVSDRALAALAQVARECPNTHMIMGEKERVADFWSHYSDAGRRQRLACREWLFELSWPNVEAAKPVRQGLRPATAAELELVMPIQAELALLKAVSIRCKSIRKVFASAACDVSNKEEHGWSLKTVNWFSKPTSSRNSRSYLSRGHLAARRQPKQKNLGTRFMSELMRRLLEDTKSICLLVNETNEVGPGLLSQVRFSLPGHLRNHLPSTEGAVQN
jgi:hypothetical protein